MKNYKVAVRYFSKTGNTKKVAEKIANSAGCKAQTIDMPISEKVDILFLGASVYKAGVDKKIKRFIESLEADKIGKVVIFSTSALAERAYPELKKLLDKKEIQTETENYYCRGSFMLLHKGRPNEQDLIEAEQFTKKIMGECK